MQYSEKRLRIEYTITRLIMLFLAAVAALSAKGWFEDISMEYASLISMAVFFLPGLWAFFTMKLIYVWAKIGHEQSDIEA